MCIRDCPIIPEPDGGGCASGKKTRADGACSGGASSYHPTKPHLIVTDCYGGPMGSELAIIDAKTGEMKQLVTIPLGSKTATPAAGASVSQLGTVDSAAAVPE